MIFNTMFFGSGENGYEFVINQTDSNGEAHFQSSFGKIRRAVFGSDIVYSGNYTYVCSIYDIDTQYETMGQGDIVVSSRFGTFSGTLEYEFNGPILSLKATDNNGSPIESMEIEAVLFQ